jgi:hypothetical protein
VCLFQSRECPFRKLSGVDCRWTGKLSDIPAHILAGHDSETVEVPAHFMVELLDFDVECRYRKVVIYLGELFYLAWETEGDILSFGVFNLGPKNETNYFKYGIRIGNSAAYDAATPKCHNYMDGDLVKLRHKDCVTLNYNRVLDCVNASGFLSCEIEIVREKLDGFVSDELQELSFTSGSKIQIRRERLDKPPPLPTQSTLRWVPEPVTALLFSPTNFSLGIPNTMLDRVRKANATGYNIFYRGPGH